MIVILVCRAVTADHGPAVVTGAFFKKGGYTGGSRPYQRHQHLDGTPIFECELVRGVDEQIPVAWPHRMKDGTSVADPDAYHGHLARYIP